MFFLKEILRGLEIPRSVYRWSDDRPKYIRKICQGVVIYKKPHAEERKGFAPVHLNRRLCTLRVTKGMKK